MIASSAIRRTWSSRTAMTCSMRCRWSAFVGARQGGLVGVENHVVGRVSGRVRCRLPALVVERTDEVGQLVRGPEDVAAIVGVRSVWGWVMYISFVQALSAKNLTPPIRRCGLNTWRGL